MAPLAVARSRVTRFARWASTPVLALLLLHAAAPAAYASIGGCRSDPVFVLSNGTELDLGATIDTGSSNVLGVTYTVHVPTGIQVLSATGWSLGSAERWSVVADMPRDQYRTDTFVTTTVQGVPVQTTTQAVGLIGATLVAVDGYNDQHLEALVAL